MQEKISAANKYLLSAEEASEYFGVGVNKLRHLIQENRTAKWVIWNGTHAYIKRKLFEEYLDSVNVI